MNEIQWKEVEYPAMFTSSAATIQQGFSQYYTDILTAADYFSNHLDSCPICNIEEKKYCSNLKKAQKEFAGRFSSFEDFFNVINSLGKMLSWVGWIHEDDPISEGSTQ